MRLFSAFSLVLLLAANCEAAFIFQIGNGGTPIVVNPGDAAVVPVYGYFSTQPEASSLRLDGFNLALDFAGPGSGLNTSVFPTSSGITTSTAGVTLGGGYQSFLAFDPGGGTPNWDKRVSASFNNSTLAAFPTANAPVRLFDLNFTVQPTAAAGTYAINGVLSPTSPSNGTLVTINAATYADIGAVNGSIQITAVPEPSSMLLLSLSALGLGVYRRRKSTKRS